MIDGISITDAAGNLSGWIVAALFVLTGRLIPRRTYDDKVHESNEWRAESRIKDQHIAELTEQNNILLREVAPTMNSFLTSLRVVAEKVEAEKAEDVS